MICRHVLFLCCHSVTKIMILKVNKIIVTIQPSRKEYHKKECLFSEVLLLNVMKIESLIKMVSILSIIFNPCF